MLDWFHDNKDAVLAIAALSSPLVAMVGTIIAAVVSFRAVTTGPRIQREIARDTIRMTQAQITAGLYGAADHQWITDFRAAIAEALAIILQVHVLPPDESDKRAPDLLRQIEPSIAKVALMVGPIDGDDLTHRIVDYAESKGREGRQIARWSIINRAREVIQAREARLATYASQGGP
jgi:hypothetical protein